MKLTKRPKRVKVNWVKTEHSYSEYVCPSCHTTFKGFVSKNTTRFKCDCGQELIVELPTDSEKEKS